MKRVVVTQSNYIPWKGYFDQLACADEVVLLDDVQYTRRDWRNRNRIKTAGGLKWLSIPVTSKGHQEGGLRICDVTVSDEEWADRHFSMIEQSYRDAAAWSEIGVWIEELYAGARSIEKLSHINRHFIDAICGYLDMRPNISWSTDHDIDTTDIDATERLVRLCLSVSADTYVSGPAAKNYLDVSAFNRAGIQVEWVDYSGYETYDQPHGEFEHGVTMLDLIASVGERSRNYLKTTSTEGMESFLQPAVAP